MGLSFLKTNFMRFSYLLPYCVSTSASHYDWAMKKIRAHKKNCLKMESEK
jgi:hypothetical protein